MICKEYWYNFSQVIIDCGNGNILKGRRKDYVVTKKNIKMNLYYISKQIDL